MYKPLQFQILDYLNLQDDSTIKIDIALPFLNLNDTNDQRLKLKAALTLLESEKLIEVSGSLSGLTNKLAGVNISKYHTRIQARITKLGKNEIMLQKKLELTFKIEENHPLEKPVFSSFSRIIDDILFPKKTFDIDITGKERNNISLMILVIACGGIASVIAIIIAWLII